MKKIAPAQLIESRWPVALTILGVLVLLTILPDRIKLFPIWVPYVLGITTVASMAVAPLTSARQWLRLERIVILTFCIIAGAGNLVSLTYLIKEMVLGSTAIDGVYLLTSSIALGVTNVLMFALLYWQLDRGGPEARVENSHRRPDWLFTQLPDETPDDWHPTFVDYLFLAFTTATAFSPTDTLPLTQRAKLLMMLESSIALVTIAAVASRAINILGS